MEQSRKSSIVVQGSILAIAALIVRIIGLVYKIPLTRILTSEGMGYNGAAFEMYMFFMMASAFGFPGAISNMHSATFAQNKYKKA